MAESKPEANKPPATKPAAKPETKKEAIKEKLPEKMVKALEKEGYQVTQIMANKSYKEQKLWRVVTTDGQRHEISYDGELLSGGSLAKRKERADAKKKADGKKGK